MNSPETESNEHFNEAIKKRIKIIIDDVAFGRIPEFASQLSVKDATVRNWTKQENTAPNAENLMEICKKFEISAEWLLCGEGEMRPDFVSRWDTRYNLWCAAWLLNPEYLDQKLFDIYRDALEQRIKQNTEGKEEKEKSTYSLIWKAFERWASLCGAWIKTTRQLEDDRNMSLAEVKKKYKRSKPKKLDELLIHQNKLEQFYLKMETFRKQMLDCETEINIYFNIFKED
jgi:transcriptional regulator with XRE-family HTH domain